MFARLRKINFGRNAQFFSTSSFSKLKDLDTLHIPEVSRPSYLLALKDTELQMSTLKGKLFSAQKQVKSMAAMWKSEKQLLAQKLESEEKKLESEEKRLADKLESEKKRLAEKLESEEKRLADKLESAEKLRKSEEKLWKSEIEKLEYRLGVVQGTLTGRGVFEFLMRHVHGNERMQGRFNATNVARLLDNHNKNDTKPVNTDTQKMMEIFKSCDQSAADLYKTLSFEIHGSPWSGPDVKLHLNKLQPSEQCAIKKLVALSRFPYKDEAAD